jgi:outer membrane immunogenic protein
VVFSQHTEGFSRFRRYRNDGQRHRVYKAPIQFPEVGLRGIMRSKFNVLALVAVSLAIVNFAPVSAHAADMPLKAPAPAPVAFTWTGVYLGIEAGWKGSSDPWTTTCLGLSPDFCNPGRTASNSYFVDATSPTTFKTNSARVGGYAGYNWQIGPAWLVGVEADLAWSDNRSTVLGIVGCSVNCGYLAGAPIAGDSTSVRMMEDGSVRGRLGFLATPDLLLFGTGGFAFQEAEFSESCTSAGPWCVAVRNQTNSTALLPGWTVGGGIEHKILNHWLLRAEYRYSEFQRFQTNFFQGTGDDTFNSIKLRTNIATAGIAYKF